MTDDEIMAAVFNAREACLNAMIAEVDKGPNRLVAIVRDHSRVFEKRMKGVAQYASGGFMAAMKRELAAVDLGETMNAAVRYL